MEEVRCSPAAVAGDEAEGSTRRRGYGGLWDGLRADVRMAGSLLASACRRHALLPLLCSNRGWPNATSAAPQLVAHQGILHDVSAGLPSLQT